jgi:hypothetical protein
MIKRGEDGWEKYVPHKVEEAIKEQGLFDYPKTNSTGALVEQAKIEN